ncbi:GNAT family N-acetyltransferase [Hymenobacter latericus]|uniref:GNAT family N-acetyltransferase n=1 Tax=Hymenobacter sp. YIM 151858-1 TaxID=2987688 RepID=UPI002226EEF4|nr:GNAT family N-acetyltransferase [Hymenobacter sp. YIM 151858-1]UYZ58939.1 GNAT family N-acetyltransferase [Hymenobacter sp. YIM 151858-1]
MLRSDTVYLRALEANDLGFLYEIENDPSVWGLASDTLTPISRHSLRQYLDNAAADFYAVRQMRLVICTNADNQAVGTVDLFNFDPHHRRAAVGIMVANTHRRRGYAAEALQLLLNYARNTLQLHQVYCTVAANNAASLRLFKAAAFRRVGVRYQWLADTEGWQDAVEMQRLLAG